MRSIPIVQMRNGGLIVLADLERARQVVQAGFFLNVEFTPQRVVELSKMDRAIVIDEDLKRIYYANAYLVPDPSSPPTRPARATSQPSGSPSSLA
jgi:diadenylate cyclase